MNKIKTDGLPHPNPRMGQARRCVAGLVLTVACQCALAQAMYQIKPLGYLGGCTTSAPTAVGLNNLDQVAGTACNAHGDTHAFLWRNDGKPMVDLGPSDVGSTSKAVAINASGLVGGNATDSSGNFAFESSGGTAGMKRIGLGGRSVQFTAMNDLGQLAGAGTTTGIGRDHLFLWANDGTGPKDLGELPDDYGYASAINAAGQIAGYASDVQGGAYAFVWKNDGSPVLNLGDFGGTNSGACCINSRGEVAGSSSLSGRNQQHAFVWRDDGKGMIDLGTLPHGSQSVAYALNELGQVVGSSFVRYYANERAVEWMNNGTPMKDLGTLGGNTSRATAINASGEATGWAALAGDSAQHAFLWRNDGTKMQDMNALVDSTDPLRPYITLTGGTYINDHGDVLAQGTDSRTAQSGLYLLQGTVLTLSPRSLAFGNQKIHTASAAKTATVTNTSGKAVAITSIALAGTAAGQFASTNNCGSSLAGHATCTIKMTFKPTAKGAKSAFVNVNGGGAGLRSVSLTGTGT